jgi:DNA-binding response OmpR family regulator
MPVMDGYTATREIRAWEKANDVRRVPIVAVTAHALNGAAAASLEVGCDAHLTKPLERSDLIDAIAKFAERPTPRTQALPDMIAARRPAFLANRSLDAEKMRAALAIRDFAVVQRIGHNCKGIGKGYGFALISEIGARIEKAARALDEAEVLASLADFESFLKTAVADAA